MSSDRYSNTEKIAMLTLARTIIESAIEGKKEPEIDPKNKFLKETLSCFVTLNTSSGELRGCIGNIGAFEPLGDNIIHNAFNAAFKDPRFPSLNSIEELKMLNIEISVLTPPKQIETLKDFIIGKHGIILNKSGKSSLFLPQVAPEQGWDKETTLTHLSMKAGLSPDAWRDEDACFDLFEAIVFSE